MQEQTETKPAQPCSAASPIRQLPHWKVIPLLILLRLPANIIFWLSYISFCPHRTLYFLRSGPQQQKRQSRGRRGTSALCVASHYDWDPIFNPAIPTGAAHWFPWWPPHQHSKHSRNRTVCCAMSREFSEDQTYKQIWNYTQLYAPKGSRDATGSFKKFTSYLPLSSSIIILSHSLALIRLLGGTWMQGMLQHCQGHYKASLGLESPPCYTHRHPH